MAARKKGAVKRTGKKTVKFLTKRNVTVRPANVIVTNNIRVRRGPFGRIGTRGKLFLLCLAVVAAAAAYAYLYRPELLNVGSASSGSIFTLIPELSTDGYKLASVDVAYDSQNGVVSLTSGCRRIVAFVERDQAESIYRGINRIIAERPNAHDIMVDSMRDFGIEVVMAKVTDLQNSSFYGSIILRQGNTVSNLDARPSDATAIAVRVGAPVYVKSELFDSEGEEIC
jgi:bifunctional DNase/RNase